MRRKFRLLSYCGAAQSTPCTNGEPRSAPSPARGTLASRATARQGSAGCSCIPDRRDISERPAVVDSKERSMHWEGDTVPARGAIREPLLRSWSGCRSA